MEMYNDEINFAAFWFGGMESQNRVSGRNMPVWHENRGLNEI